MIQLYERKKFIKNKLFIKNGIFDDSNFVLSA